MIWAIWYVVALASASVAKAGKSGCNIKAVGSKKRKGSKRRLGKKSSSKDSSKSGSGKDKDGGGCSGSASGKGKAKVEAMHSQLDLGDFDYEKCKKHKGPGKKMEMEVQLNPLERSSLFDVEQHQNHPRAFTGKRLKTEAGARKIGEMNIIFGERGDMSGSAQMDGNIYLFTTLEDGSAWTEEIKLSDLPPDDEEVNLNLDELIKEEPKVNVVGEETRMLRQRELQEESDERLVIDVLVPFTRQTLCAIAQAGSPDRCAVNERRLEMVQTRIELAIFEANVAFENSGIPGRLRLAHSYLIDQEVEDWDENYWRYGDILYQLACKGDGILDGIHEQRVKYGADVVSLWVSNMSSCGLGYMGTPVAKDWAFSVVNWLCATGYYSFVHEIAHHLGAKHDRPSHRCPDPECCGQDCYNYGWQDPLGRFRSIMSYNCPTEQGCPRVQYFSQPQNFYPLEGGEEEVREVRIGSGSMNNARIIRETFKIVASYHESVFDQTPPTPAPVAATHCGNGVCEPQKYEDCKSCPQDCIGGIYQDAECDNGICEDGENCNNCPQDCPMRLDVFRDDLKYCCEGGPKEQTGQIPFGVSCGDHSYCTFNTQCDTNPPKTGTYCCGNGICELGENVGTCATDCQCQDNGVCDLFEDGSCTDCQDVSLTTTKCMGVGRVCTAIFEDPCCGSCNANTRKCV